MSDFFKHFLEYITDSSKHAGKRATIAIAIIICILLGDYYFGASYYFNMDLKVKRVKEVSELLRDTTLSKDEKAILKQLRQRLIVEKTSTRDYFAFLSPKSPNTRIRISKENNIVITVSSIYENIWFKLTAFGFYILLAIVGFVFMIIQDIPVSQRILGIATVVAISATIGALVYWIGTLLPVFEDHFWINCVFNLAIQLLSLFGLIKSLDRR